MSDKTATERRNSRVVLPIFAGIIIVTAIFYISTKNSKETLLSGMALNSDNAISEKVFTILSNDFVSELRLDPSETEISFNTSRSYSPDKKTRSGGENYATILLHTSQTTRGWLDFVMGDQESLSVLAYGNYYADLSLILTEEQIELFGPYLLYIDRTVLERLEETIISGEYDVLDQIPDSTKPEDMENPIPVFIDVSDCEYIKDIYPDIKNSVVFAIATNTPNAGLALKFIEFLLAQP